MHDLHNNSRAVRSIDPAALTTVAGIAGKVIDRQGFGGVEFIFAYGATGASTADIPVVIKEGDVTGTLTSVADADLIGTEALAGVAAGTPKTSGVSQQVVKRIGYKGSKRYVQVSLTNAGTTSAGLIWADALLFNPEQAPVSNP